MPINLFLHVLMQCFVCCDQIHELHQVSFYTNLCNTEKGAWVTFSKMRFLLLCIHYIYLHIQILWLGVVIRTLPMKYSMLKSLPENVGIRGKNGSRMFSVVMHMTCHYL